MMDYIMMKIIGYTVTTKIEDFILKYAMDYNQQVYHYTIKLLYSYVTQVVVKKLIEAKL